MAIEISIKFSKFKFLPICHFFKISKKIQKIQKRIIAGNLLYKKYLITYKHYKYAIKIRMHEALKVK